MLSLGAKGPCLVGWDSGPVFLTVQPGGDLGVEKAACPVLQSKDRELSWHIGPLPCLVPVPESSSPTKHRPPRAWNRQLLHCPALSTRLASLRLVLPQPQLMDPSLSAHLVTPWPMRPSLQTWPQSRADGSDSRKPDPALRVDTVPSPLIELVPYPGGPRLPLGLASGCWACTQTSQPLFVQAKASPPPPGQLALDQWPRAMAGVSGPCPLWPVAPGSMGLR